MQIPPITFSNIITFVGMVFALGSGWAVVSQQLNRLNQSMEVLSGTVSDSQNYLDDKITKVEFSLEQNILKVEESVASLRSDMNILFERQDVIGMRVGDLEGVEKSTRDLLGELMVVTAVEREKLEGHLSKSHGQGHAR